MHFATTMQSVGNKLSGRFTVRFMLSCCLCADWTNADYNLAKHEFNMQLARLQGKFGGYSDFEYKG